MMIVKIENGVVVQADRSTNIPPDGWVAVEGVVICGQVDNGDGTFSNPAKSLADIKAKGVAGVKAKAASIFTAHDWYFTRQLRTEAINARTPGRPVKPVPDATLDYLQGVEEEMERVEAAILAATTEAECAAIEATWPLDPNAVI